MKVKYTLDRKLTFEEMCKVVLMINKDGLYVIDREIDYNSMFLEMMNSNEDIAFIINNCDIKLDGYKPKEALEKYEMIVELMEDGE